jgi:hypothetical protein
MLDVLEGLGEYDNVGALLGLDGLEGNEELLGALRKMNPVKRQRVINSMASNGGKSRGSRAEMEKHFGELPEHIRAALVSGDLRLADTIIYSIKPANSKTVKMFETQDVKEVGLRNISNAKLPKNQALLVSGIILLAGIPADATTDKVIGTKYGRLEDFASIANGEFSLKANKKIIMPETSIGAFKTDNMHNLPIGYYKLANPRLIHDDILVEATIELGSMFGIDPLTHLFCGLHGTITTP